MTAPDLMLCVDGQFCPRKYDCLRSPVNTEPTPVSPRANFYRQGMLCHDFVPVPVDSQRAEGKSDA